MTKLPKTWTNHKKSPTNPDKKEAHINRAIKKILIQFEKELDWQQQLIEYNKNNAQTEI